MKLRTILFFSILTILTSCNGQTKNKASNSDDLSQNIAQGDTVNKLGDHLWYVFQDKKNNYWFGSNGEGVYRLTWACADSPAINGGPDAE